MARGVIVVATGVTESFMMQVKTSLVAGIIAAFPIIVWQIGGFVWPALYGEEKKRFVLSFLALVLLFVSGIVFAYVAVFPLAVNLFYESGLGHARAMWSIDGYFNFVLSFLLPFGLMFELPVIIYLLARAGKITNRAMNRARRYFILGATVAAAFLTPPDVVSQIFLLIPLIALYEVSALLARLVQPKRVEIEE